MMLQKLPLELVSAVAQYLSLEDMGEFASSCHWCYFAVLPHLWNQLDLSTASDLCTVAQKLQYNEEWCTLAEQYVHRVTLRPTLERKYSSTQAASMFGIASTSQDQSQEVTQATPRPYEKISSFGKRILDLFPHVTDLVVDFASAAKQFYTTSTSSEPLQFSGTVALVNYQSDQTKTMHSFLAPFRRVHHLQLKAQPIVSLCDDVDNSILTSKDLADLATLRLTHVRQLELSYLDPEMDLDVVSTLLQSLTKLQTLELEWIFPPSEQVFQQLCQVLLEERNMVPIQVKRKAILMKVQFVLNIL